MNKKFLVLLLTLGQTQLMLEAHGGGGGGGGGGHHGGGGGGGHHSGGGGHHSGGRGYGGRGYGGRGGWGGRGAWAGFAMWGSFWLLATMPLWYSNSGKSQQDWNNASKYDRLQAGIDYLTAQSKLTPGDTKLQAQINDLVTQQAKL